MVDDAPRLLLGKRFRLLPDAAQQRVRRGVIQFAQLHQRAQIRHAVAPLPFGNGFIRIVDLHADLRLGKSLVPAIFRQILRQGLTPRLLLHARTPYF